MLTNKSDVSIFKIFIEILKYTFQCWPTAMVVYLVVGLIFGSMTGANVWVMQYAFDAVTALAVSDGMMQEAIFALVFFIVFLLAQEVIISMYYYYMNNIGGRMQGFMCKKVAEKTTKIDPILFENPKVLDDINKALEGAPLAFWAGNTIIIILIFYVPFILVTSIYLYTLSPLLVIVIVLSFAPKIISLVIRAKLYTNLEEKSAPLRRESKFYEDAMVDRQYFKETRMLGAFGFFKEKYLKSIRLLNRETWKADAHAATFDLITEILAILSYFGILYLLFSSLRNGLITVGAFAAVLASINLLSEHIDILITYHFAKIAEDLGKISYLVKLFDLSEKTGENIKINWQGDIEFKDVGFIYPNAKQFSLNGLSLTIKSGETVAIVGENGAGKSTFTKLLMGLYEPSHGEILVDGQKIKNITPKELFKGVSAVFQQYQRYQLTLEENIQISDVGATNDIFPVMEEAGVEWESRSYPDGVNTVLSREFDGVDLSGGQWQRIAIARGLYRHHHLIVLDEPTAAIDPIEESRLYKKFAEISKDETAVIVTHRLGLAQIADRIIVLENGKVVEVGTHQELLEIKGHYARMYESQASWYMNETNNE